MKGIILRALRTFRIPTHLVFALALALALALPACQEVSEPAGPASGAFTSKTVVGMYNANLSAVVAFDQNNNQLAFISTNIESRLQDNTPNVLMRCRLSTLPIVVGQIVSVDLSGKNVPTGSYTTTLTKRSGDLVWLWSDDANVGFILFVPQV